ncbi:zinc-finger-containing protein [Bacillus toyonensis]|uniref:zinc-finger-containing protein n=1 Tax=Bacillus toyonensis TaxID=155322 RepID=UPI003D1BEA16
MEIPKICPFCGSDVVFTSNKELYGKEYGNRKSYLCRKYKASAGTQNGTTKSLGIMANREMKVLKNACHDLFEVIWKNKILIGNEK